MRTFRGLFLGKVMNTSQLLDYHKKIPVKPQGYILLTNG